MAAPSRSSASWERVLAAIEADAARAAALLVSDDAHANAGIEYDGQDATPPIAGGSGEPASIPATWRLPATPSPTTGTLSAGAAARAVAGYAANRVPSPAATMRPSAEAVAALSLEVDTAPSETPDSQTRAAGALDTAHLADALTELPDPDDMPPMTDEQRARFDALRERIEALKAQLAAAVSEAEEVLARPIPRRAAPEQRPEFVDRRL